MITRSEKEKGKKTKKDVRDEEGEKKEERERYEEKTQQWEKCSQVEIQQKNYSPSQYPSSLTDSQGRKAWRAW